MPQEEKKYIKTSTGLLIILAVAVIIGGGAIAYFYVNSPPSLDFTAQTRVSIHKNSNANTNTATTTTDVTKEWKTYTDSDYGLSFKYPKDWTTPTKEDSAAADSLTGIAERYLTFEKNTNGNYKSASLTKYSDYANTDSASNLEKIKTVFNDQSATGTEKLLLPQIGASVMATTEPQYIMTVDKKFRGIYYFANIGQDYSTNITCVIIMTDGKDKVVQYTMSANSVKAADYSITQDENKAFISYVNNLDVKKSTETLVKDFNSTYKLMAQSLKLL